MRISSSLNPPKPSDEQPRTSAQRAKRPAGAANAPPTTTKTAQPAQKQRQSAATASSAKGTKHPQPGPWAPNAEATAAAMASHSRRVSQDAAVTSSEKKPSAEGWLARAMSRDSFAAAEVGARDAVTRELGKERLVLGQTMTKGVDGVSVGVGGAVRAQVALKPNDPLVTSNADRLAAVKNQGMTWSKVTASGQVSTTVATGAHGVGLSLGYARASEITAIVPSEKTISVRNAVDGATKHAQVLATQLTPDRITTFPPGTEFRVTQGSAVGGGTSIGVGTPSETIQLAAAVSVSESRAKQYAKRVVVENDRQVKVEIDQMKSTTDEAAAGVSAGLNVDVAQAANAAGRLGINQLKNHTSIAVSVAASSSKTDSIGVTAHLDPASKEGRAAYEYLMSADPKQLEANPQAAKAALEKIGVGVSFHQTSSVERQGATARVGKFNLVNSSNAARDTKATVFEARSTDAGVVTSQRDLREREFSRSVNGFLPRLFVGEEREVTARIGSVTQAGVETRAALFSIAVKDPSVTAQEHGEITRFANAFGVAVPETSAQKEERGVTQVKIALTDAAVTSLDAVSRNDVRAGMEAAMERIEGGPLPWKNESASAHNRYASYEKRTAAPTVKERFLSAIKQWEGAPHDKVGDVRKQLLRDYKATTGRDLQRDLASYAAIDAVSEAIAQTKGAPVEGRGAMLSAIGKLSSRDLRATMLMLHDVAGAGLVGFTLNANGVKVETVDRAPPSLADTLAQARR